MWFKNAIGKEKIQFIFGNELHIKNIEISIFSLERFSDLKIHFFCKEILEKHPEKWKKDGFTALSLMINFGDVIHLNATGSGIGFFCSPEINSFENLSEIKIKNNELDFYCKSKFLTIESITPYIDERWD